MLDGLTYNDESFDMFRRIALEKNCVIITAQQARRIIDSEQVKIMVNTKAMQMSEVVFGINRNVKLSFWSRVKYFFCFWKQKPNRNLKVLKSRYGKESSKNIFVDFEKVKITE